MLAQTRITQTINQQGDSLINESSIAEYITKTFPDVETTTNLGYTFFFYREERIHAFATIASTGNEYEQVSKLDRARAFSV